MLYSVMLIELLNINVPPRILPNSSFRDVLSVSEPARATPATKHSIQHPVYDI